MTAYVEIAVLVPQATRPFDYHLPPNLEGQVLPGCLVVVPFGTQAVQGIVLRTVETPSVPETRPVGALVDPKPVVTPQQMALAAWLAEASLAPLAPCLERMLPPGLARHAESLFRLSGDLGGSLASGSPMQAYLVALLKERGELRSRQLDRAVTRGDWRPAMQGLVRRGVVFGRSYLPPPSVQAKTIRTAQLAVAPEEAETAVPGLGRVGSAAQERRAAVVRLLIREPMPVAAPWVYAETGASLSDLQALAEKGLVTIGETEIWRDPLDGLDAPPDTPPPLTADQQGVLEALLPTVESASTAAPPPPFLLHGVTGSGKTEIYLRAVAETLRQGRQAIVLVPEIALTPQTVRRFVSRFPGQVGLIHSQLSEGERYDTWRRARLGLLRVIVGPRSALFAPLPNPGLIVIDECHDESYAQDEAVPYYHAVTTAIKLAELSGAVCLLGSATPDVALTYRARRDGWPVLHLANRILAHRQTIERQSQRLGIQVAPHPVEGEAAALGLPPVSVVDMRQELKEGNRQIFSRRLVAALEETLNAGQQAILFLNRRGTATYVFCRDCGQSLNCPNCELPLTFHTPRAALACHYCGFERPMPPLCPTCGSPQIRQFGTGTERVESEVQALFPGLRTLRWDAETTRQKGAHEVILAHFAAHRADVLVGTQMLAKGLDLPFVTLVGVVLADVGLGLPDYRATERTFQVLTQVAGRAGRSLLGGRVVLQTFMPEHYVIRAAAGHDFEAFYGQELAYRRELGYPPFYRLVRLEYRHTEPERAEKAAHEMGQQIQTWLREEDRRATEMAGPVPCFFGRLHGVYRWQIVLRGPDPASLLKGRPLGDWRVEVDPPNLL